MRLFIKVLIVLVCLGASPALAASKVLRTSPQAAPDPNAAGLTEFFRTEGAQTPKSLDFQIQGGYADIRTDLPESSGRYFLAGQSVTPVARDIYKLDMTFKKKYQRDVIDYNPEYFFTQQRTYYFWYDGGKQLVFKLGGSKKVIQIPKKELTQIKVQTPETYTVQHTKIQMDFKFQDGGTTVYLQVKFI